VVRSDGVPRLMKRRGDQSPLRSRYPWTDPQGPAR
jgi:hypothetical protein